MDRATQRRLRQSVTAVLLVAILSSGLVPYLPAPAASACYTWSVGARVGLKRGAEIRTGSSLGSRVHTNVPEDNWQVDIIGGPRSADGQEWWDISRRNLDGGGTGWVYKSQAGYDLCGSNPSPQQPQPASPERVSGVSLSTTLVYPGDRIEGSFVVRNGGGQDWRPQKLGIQVDGPSYLDFGWREGLTIRPGESHTFQGAIPNAPDVEGTYNVHISWQDGGTWRSLGGNTSFTVQRRAQPTATPIPPSAARPERVSGITLSTTSAYPGDRVEGTFVVRNGGGQDWRPQRLGIQVDGPSYLDFGWREGLIIRPGESYTFQGAVPTAPDTPGTYNIHIAWQDGGTWRSLGGNASFTVQRRAQPTVEPTRPTATSTTTPGPTPASTAVPRPTATATPTAQPTPTRPCPVGPVGFQLPNDGQFSVAETYVSELRYDLRLQIELDLMLKLCPGIPVTVYATGDTLISIDSSPPVSVTRYGWIRSDLPTTTSNLSVPTEYSVNPPSISLGIRLEQGVRSDNYLELVEGFQLDATLIPRPDRVLVVVLAGGLAVLIAIVGRAAPQAVPAVVRALAPALRGLLGPAAAFTVNDEDVLSEVHRLSTADVPQYVTDDLVSTFGQDLIDLTTIGSLVTDSEHKEPGQFISYRGANFTPNGLVSLTLGLPNAPASSIELETRANSNGEIAGQVQIPPAAKSGRWLIAAVDTHSMHAQLEAFAAGKVASPRYYLAANSVMVGGPTAPSQPAPPPSSQPTPAPGPQPAPTPAPSSQPSPPPSPRPSQPTLPPLPNGPTVTFAETGKMVGGPFLAHWQGHGLDLGDSGTSYRESLALHGFPISDPFVEVLEDGKPYWVQYFERVRMEYHPNNAPPYDVLLGQFGRRIRPQDPPAIPKAGQTYFAETGHNLGASFLAYWQSNGGLAQFGFPISEVFREQLEDGREYEVQYFERARFELHLENAPPYDVLLGQFGRRILHGMDNPPVSAPVSPPPSPPTAATCTATTRVDRHPVVGVPWIVPGDGWRILNFWTNEPRKSQHERKLLLAPGENPGLLGGGSLWSRPSSCEAEARADYAQNPNPPVTLAELFLDGLIASGYSPPTNVSPPALVDYLGLWEYGKPRDPLPPPAMSGQVIVANGDITNSATCHVRIFGPSVPVEGLGSGTFELRRVTGTSEQIAAAAEKIRLGAATDPNNRAGTCDYLR